MLRRILIGIGLLYLLGAVVLLYYGQTGWVIAYLALEGAVIVAAVVFERWKDRPTVDRTRGRWQATGERFVDPGSGRLQEVWFNPDTGERDYVDAGTPPPGGPT